MENQSGEKKHRDDEIDLGQIFVLIGRGFQRIFKAFLKLFVYIKHNAVILAILIIVGGLIGYGLSFIVNKKLKTEVIVRPNLGSESYLYEIINEIEANIQSADTAFFNKFDINVARLDGFGIEIEPIQIDGGGEGSNEVEYLELLEKFRDEVGVLDVVRTEILKNSTVNHRIVFYFKEGTKGREIAEKLMAYINNNEFYKQLASIYTKNAENRIVRNDELVTQIDNIIKGYTAQMEREAPTGGSLILKEEEQLNVTNLLRLKNEIIADTEKKRLEIQGNVDAIRIISFGSTQEISKAFFGNTIVLVPTILIGILLLIDLAKYLNRKAREMELE